MGTHLSAQRIPVFNEYQHDNLDGFQKSFRRCALDESSLSIESVDVYVYGGNCILSSTCDIYRTSYANGCFTTKCGILKDWQDTSSITTIQD